MNTALPLKIAFFEHRKGEKIYLSKKLKDFNIQYNNDKLTVDNALEYKDVDVVCVFINSVLDESALKVFTKLKLIVTRSTGFDHIDLRYCAKAGIKVCNVPSYGENTVAEHAMALLLGIVRRLPESIERIHLGKFTPEGLTGKDLKGKVMGVMGTGHIGINLIKMSLGFSMKVIAYDLFPKKELAEHMGFEYVDTDYLFQKSDFISLHLPFTPETNHIINRDSINMMKEGVVIINTARGGLIETDALFDGLKSGKIGGAGLDVLEEEGFLKEEIELLYKEDDKDFDFKIALENHLMSYFPNVIITPHNAFNSEEALQRILDTTVNNIVSFSNGKVINPVVLK
jgi:D-lactate dehydrogenase